ncbi:MAG TPA: hypothetical protein VFC72_07330 [Corynebacterium sp.]|nr:hypothetical protein [Corynebacterium sp.]
MVTRNTVIGRVYSTPQSRNGWAWLNSINAWRRVATTSTDGHSNTFLALAAARGMGTVRVDTDSADQFIVAVYV